MERKKRSVPEVNSTSTADMSFLLLCFFLMTSSMDQSMGIHRILPPIPPEGVVVDDQNKIKAHNVLMVLVDGQDRLSVNGRLMHLSELKQTTKEFILNPNGDKNKSSKRPEDIPGIAGKVEVSEAVVSLQNVRSTSYDMYLKVQNELTAAYNELRDEESMFRFGRKFKQLNETQRETISSIHKQRISESPPKDTRKKK